MLRTAMMILAFAALLATAACTDITAPTAGNGSTLGNDSDGGDRTPAEVGGPDEVVPDPGAGGGGEDDIEDAMNRRGDNRRRTPGDHAPEQP